MKRVITLLLLVCCFRVIEAEAETIVLQPQQDTSIFSESTNSNGAGADQFAGATRRGDIRRTLVRFDAAQLPAGSIVDAVTLTFTLLRSRDDAPRTMTLHRLLASWGEASSVGRGAGGTPQPGDATWLQRFFPDMMWKNEGGDFTESAGGSAEVGGSDDVGRSFSISGDGMIDDVLFWIANPDQNHGWIIRGDERVAQSSRSFDELTLTIDFSPALEADAGDTPDAGMPAAPAISLADPENGLRFSVTLTAGPEPVDIYIGYRSPGGGIVSLVFAGGAAVELPEVQPIAAGFTPIDLAEFFLFARPFGADDAVGGYLLFAALARQGSDPLAPGSLISLFTTALSFPGIGNSVE